MSRRTLGGVGRAWLGASWVLSGALFAQEPVVQEPQVAATPDRAELERLNATIRAINVTVDNVFDPSNPDEDKKLYRWANRVHILTRESVVESVLLFQVGDTFRARLLDESARTLRASGFLSDASCEPLAYDPVTNSVEVNVRVRDSWSLAPDLDLSRSGGVNEYEIGMSDGNLFGTGKELTLSYSSDVDRTEAFFGYGDPNVFNSRIRLSAVLANASDGHRRAFAAERPFYAIDTRWQLGGNVRDEERVDTMYDLGEEIDNFRHDISSITLQGGWSPGFNEKHRALRWLMGVTSEEDTFVPTPERPQPLLLPTDRDLVFPWVGVQLVEDDYREMTELNDMGRTEDVSLGLNVYFSIGFAKERFGSDRNATLYRANAQMGWEPGGPGNLLLLTAGGWTRDETEGLVNSVMFAGLRYYHRNLDKHLFLVNLEGLTSNNLDGENQVLLGGDNGLRGYPLRYQSGKHRALLTVEQRFYTEWYPWRLFRVGYAAFVDTGRVWGQDPRGTPSLGTLSDVGVGLRLTSPRSSGRNIVHIDLAFPLNGDSSIDDVQLLFETKGSF
jgi:hypothetical protein